MLREAIVPAYNEEKTVGSVVRTILKSGVFDRVLVVDDGSKDNTAIEAKRAGGDVFRMHKNGGKSRAMMAGLEHTTADPIAFFDADLVGFRPDHVRQLAHLADLEYDMVCGLRDYGILGNPLHLGMPLITGERFVKRVVLAAIPKDCWDGYDIETGMNHACKLVGAKTAVTLLRGLQIRRKSDKNGFIKGMLGEFKMFSKIYRAQKNLDCHGSCKI